MNSHAHVGRNPEHSQAIPPLTGVRTESKGRQDEQESIDVQRPGSVQDPQGEPPRDERPASTCKTAKRRRLEEEPGVVLTLYPDADPLSATEDEPDPRATSDSDVAVVMKLRKLLNKQRRRRLGALSAIRRTLKQVQEDIVNMDGRIGLLEEKLKVDQAIADFKKKQKTTADIDNVETPGGADDSSDVEEIPKLRSATGKIAACMINMSSEMAEVVAELK